jgi:O-antigen/teichoic acid export membrane protein
MHRIWSLLNPSNLRRKVFGFASMHACNAVLGMGHTLLQMAVLARVLPAPIYTAVVAVTAIGLYLQPVSQACARANYVALRDHIARKTGDSAPAEVTMLLYGSLVVTFLAGIAMSVVVVGLAPQAKLGLYLYLIGSLCNNLWYYDLQFALWAANVTTRFERLSLLRRLSLAATLVPLYLSGSLVVFAGLGVVVTLIFVAALILTVPDPRLLMPSNLGNLSMSGARAQMRHFGTAILSTLSELTVFNASYGVIFWAFRLGPALIAFDTVLKLSRVGLTVTRNISEILLPRQSRARSDGDRRNSLRYFVAALGGALVVNAGLALCLALFGDLVFRLMLGPNNVLPPYAGLPTAVVQIAATVYGASSFFLAMTGHDRQIMLLTVAAALGMAGFTAAIVLIHPAILMMLWAYATFLGAIAAASIILVLHTFAMGRFGRPRILTRSAG